MLIPIQLERDQPLQRQLYQQLRELIVTSRLQPGTRMPSTRMMAEQFAISRITVLLTYERLIAEGYLETLRAKGTYVCQPPRKGAAESPVRLETGRAGPAGAAEIGLPDPSLFPASRWRGLMRTALDRLGAQPRVPHPAGHPSLRHAITHWLSTSRGLAVAPEQIIIFNGRQQALHFAAHLVVRPGHRVVIEDPCDPATSCVLSGEGSVLHPVPVDAQGLDIASLPEGPASLVHVTPEHQRPLGVALAHGRRLGLLAWAARNAALVLEEDCDGELRYGEHLGSAPLMSLDTQERVMLLGGFTASLGPWIRITYLVLPQRLVATALAVRRMLDDGHNPLEEQALAELLHSGLYARHLHQIGRVYAGRCAALTAALAEQFGADWPVWGGAAGLSVTWAAPGPLARVVAAARGCGLEAAGVPVGPDGRAVVRLGFGTMPEERLRERVAALADRLQAGSALTALSAD